MNQIFSVTAYKPTTCYCNDKLLKGIGSFYSASPMLVVLPQAHGRIAYSELRSVARVRGIVRTNSATNRFPKTARRLLDPQSNVFGKGGLDMNELLAILKS